MRRPLPIVGLAIAAGLMLMVVFSVGIWFGYYHRPAVEVEAVSGLQEGSTPNDVQIDFSPFWRVWNLIEERYPTTTPPTQERLWGAIDGLVNSLDDPYSVFLPPEERQLFEEDIRGNFGGVGMEIGMRDDMLTVIAPLPDTPAKRAGIRSGDQIVEINGQTTKGLSVSEAVQSIRGEVGTEVKLLLWREGESDPREVTVTRGTINIPTLETELLERDGNRVFVIRLFNFGSNSASLFREALREFVQARTNKIIIDVRGNPGGYLESAVEIASWFLPLGEPVVYEDHALDEDDQVYRSRGYNIFSTKLKLAILVDGGSASASEILAGALSERGRATLVGEKTFGKGSVQELIPLPGDGALKLTVARWLTPDRHDISSEGLTPGVVVKFDPEAPADAPDPQLEAALELLNN